MLGVWRLNVDVCLRLGPLVHLSFDGFRSRGALHCYVAFLYAYLSHVVHATLLSLLLYYIIVSIPRMLSLPIPRLAYNTFLYHLPNILTPHTSLSESKARWRGKMRHGMILKHRNTVISEHRECSGDRNEWLHDTV